MAVPSERALGLIPEPVAHTPHRKQVLGIARVALDLLPQVADVDVNGPRIAIVGVAPDVLEQGLAALDPSRRRRERGEDLELDVGEADLRPRGCWSSALDVDFQVAGGDRLVGERRSRAILPRRSAAFTLLRNRARRTVW